MGVIDITGLNDACTYREALLSQHPLLMKPPLTTSHLVDSAKELVQFILVFKSVDLFVVYVYWSGHLYIHRNY